MTIQELVSESYRIAKDKGWCDRPVLVPEQVALICSEACEALEEWRSGRPMLYSGMDGKPEGVAAEFADILIRVGHYCALNGIDLESALRLKMAYNETRPYRHGNKKA